MHRAPRFALIAMTVVALAACEQARQSLVGPSSVRASGMSLSLEAENDPVATLLVGKAGAQGHGVPNSAAQESGFTCALFAFGLATRSHATISSSGNQTLHCSGETTLFTSDRAVFVEGFPCGMHFEGVVSLDSRIVITPSGQVTLTCQSKM